MPLVALGLNHQTAPLAVRERLAADEARADELLTALRAREGIRDAVLLSTCNRTEIYADLDADALSRLPDWLAQEHEVSTASLRDYLYLHHDEAAAKHLFRVSAGLDSLILGEPQILGQVKSAWQQARHSGALRGPLDRLFQQGFQVAKRVRTDTRIGAHPVSVAFAAVKLAEQRFASPSQSNVLLIGAGDTIELAARHLAEASVKRLFVANRTLEHAQQLASKHGGIAMALADVDKHLHEADIVISATAAREPILFAAQIREALRKRRQRPMLLLDLAVPRDIEPATADLQNVYLYGVDDLEQVIEENRASRREAAQEAEAIIDLQVEHFMAWWRSRDQQQLVQALRQRSDTTRDELLSRAREQLQAGDDADAVLERLAHQLTNKLMHAPTQALREAALNGQLDLLHGAERLFDLRPQATPVKDDDDAQPAA